MRRRYTLAGRRQVRLTSVYGKVPWPGQRVDPNGNGLRRGQRSLTFIERSVRPGQATSTFRETSRPAFCPLGFAAGKLVILLDNRLG